MGSTVSFTQFAPQEFYADNDAVIVKSSFAGKGTRTGKALFKAIAGCPLK